MAGLVTPVVAFDFCGAATAGKHALDVELTHGLAPPLPSRFRPPGTVSGASEIFNVDIPYRKYFLGPDNIPGDRNRVRRLAPQTEELPALAATEASCVYIPAGSYLNRDDGIVKCPPRDSDSLKLFLGPKKCSLWRFHIETIPWARVTPPGGSESRAQVNCEGCGEIFSVFNGGDHYVRYVVGRGHVSLLIILYTWHSKTVWGVGRLLNNVV
jgi:hypothetical protein